MKLYTTLQFLSNIFKEVKAGVAMRMEMSVKPQLLIVCHGLCWTFPVFSEGFICDGEMLSFRILSDGLMGMAMIFMAMINGIQVIHVVSTLQSMQKTWSASTCGTALKPEMCHLMWFGRLVKVGESPKSSYWGPCFKPDSSAPLMEGAEGRCCAFCWAVQGPTAVPCPGEEGAASAFPAVICPRVTFPGAKWVSGTVWASFMLVRQSCHIYCF